MGNLINEANLQNENGNGLMAVGTLFQIFPLSAYLCAEEVAISTVR